MPAMSPGMCRSRKLWRASRASARRLMTKTVVSRQLQATLFPGLTPDLKNNLLVSDPGNPAGLALQVGQQSSRGKFAWGCIKEGRPEPAAVAVICFEWLQRPENAVAGFLTWSGYRSKNWPHAIRFEHHKNKVLVWHPLKEPLDGETIKFRPHRLQDASE